jgi:hypothetical protein
MCTCEGLARRGGRTEALGEEVHMDAPADAPDRRAGGQTRLVSVHAQPLH